jgi:CRP/FNR family transcriptional regulator, cyclic AMP receptor protein
MTLRQATRAIEGLRGCPLFRQCDDDSLRAVVGSMRQRHFRRNEVIFHQGDPGDSLHVISSGSIKIVLPSPDGEEAIIATLREGDFFGELALLDGEPRSATAAAVEASETWSLPRESFIELLDGRPGLRDALLRALSGELRRLTVHVEELHFLDLAGRLAHRLVWLAERTLAEQSSEPSLAERSPAAGGSGAITLDWPYTQSDLASMIGGTRQSVNKLLSELVVAGLVVMERDTILIPSVAALARQADR